jgi:iron(III) transport system ATP-binding protein
MNTLQISNLVKWFGSRTKLRAVDNISAEVESGEFLVLLGPSGCGKTTLLRCVAGLEEAQEGSISLGGQKVFDAAIKLDVPTHKRNIGMVFQNYSLWPHMTVAANVEYPLRARGFKASKRKDRVQKMLGVVQCEHLADRFPAMLSGGQQQRIALARALASEPAIMLLDEPLSNLDALLRDDLRAQLRAIHRELSFTGIYVTHDQTEAFTIGTRVAVMNAGHVEQLGTASDVYGEPATEYVARFLGIRNAIPLTSEPHWAAPFGPLKGDLGLFKKRLPDMRIYVRADDVNMAAAHTDLGQSQLGLGNGRVIEAMQISNETSYVLRIGDFDIYARQPLSTPLFNIGEEVGIGISHSAALIYSNGKLVQ